MSRPAPFTLDGVFADVRDSSAPSLAGDLFKEHLQGWLSGKNNLVGEQATISEWMKAAKPGAHIIVLTDEHEADLWGAMVRTAGAEVRDTVIIVAESQTVFVILARKPVEDAIARHVLKWGVGPLNVDATRVGTGTGEEQPEKRPNFKNQIYGKGLGGAAWVNSDGRWPPNVLFRHSPGCKPDGVRSVKSPGGGRNDPPRTDGVVHTGYQKRIPTVYGDVDGREVVEVWSCTPECPVAALDKQSGNIITRFIPEPHASARGGSNYTGSFQTNRGARGYDDEGGASRFFPQGTDHDLLCWLVRLVVPSGGVAWAIGSTSGRREALERAMKAENITPWSPTMGESGPEASKDEREGRT